MSEDNERLILGDEYEEVLVKARIGQAAREFFQAPLGKYVAERAMAELSEAKEKLLDCKVDTPWGRKKFKRLQNEAALPALFMAWMAEAITDGDTALSQLEAASEYNLDT